MIDPKTLEEAIQIIKSMQRCGICKRNIRMDGIGGQYCELQYDKHIKKNKPVLSLDTFAVESFGTCEHWE